MRKEGSVRIDLVQADLSVSLSVWLSDQPLAAEWMVLALRMVLLVAFSVVAVAAVLPVAVAVLLMVVAVGLSVALDAS